MAGSCLPCVPVRVFHESGDKWRVSTDKRCVFRNLCAGISIEITGVKAHTSKVVKINGDNCI